MAIDSFLDVLRARRPSLRPLLGGTSLGKRGRWLKVSVIAALTFMCVMSLHALSDNSSSHPLSAQKVNMTTTIIDVLEDTRKYEARPSDWDSCDSIRMRADKLPDIKWQSPADLVFDVELSGWEDEWIAHGTIKNGSTIHPHKVDFVYTYVRSDQDFFDMKKPYDAAHPRAEDLRWQTIQASRFRSWDELRYSIRGTMKNAASWLSRINIVAKDFEHVDPETNNREHILQSPPWINATYLEDGSQITVIPETSVLKNVDCSPIFNSVSLESSFGNIPLTTDHFVGMSDDMLLGKETCASDFTSPLFGMCFSWYPHIWELDEVSEPNLKDGELGEGHAARFTSYLLNKRFGRRARTLQLHHAKIINQKILNEAMATFPRAAAKTPLSRWRDDSQQLYSWYLHMHYTMEMHREALLWSITMRFDENNDGELQLNERAQLRREIEEGINSNGRRHVMPMLGQMQQKFRDAALDDFKIQKVDHTSLDGPQQLKHLTFEECSGSFSLGQCFGADFADDGKAYSTDTLFNRLRSPELGVRCGDCLIKYLLNNADLGLSSLLPKSGSKHREAAIKALHKYQYTETSPDNSFLMVRNVADAGALPSYADRVPGLMCINDDITTKDPNQLATIANGYHEFFERLFPEPSIFEQIKASDFSEVTKPEMLVAEPSSEPSRVGFAPSPNHQIVSA